MDLGKESMDLDKVGAKVHGLDVEGRHDDLLVCQDGLTLLRGLKIASIRGCSDFQNSKTALDRDVFFLVLITKNISIFKGVKKGLVA